MSDCAENMEQMRQYRATPCYIPTDLQAGKSGSVLHVGVWMAETAANRRGSFASTFYLDHFSNYFMKGGERQAKIVLCVAYRSVTVQETGI